MMTVETIPSKNKATNPELQPLLRCRLPPVRSGGDLVLGRDRSGALRSRDAAEALLHRQSPRLEQPFGDVAPISVAFAPVL
jgi:hypothetical protein